MRLMLSGAIVDGKAMGRPLGTSNRPKPFVHAPTPVAPAEKCLNLADYQRATLAHYRVAGLPFHVVGGYCPVCTNRPLQPGQVVCCECGSSVMAKQ